MFNYFNHAVSVKTETKGDWDCLHLKMNRRCQCPSPDVGHCTVHGQSLNERDLGQEHVGVRERRKWEGLGRTVRQRRDAERKYHV